MSSSNKYDPITLTRWLLLEQRAHPDAEGDFTNLLGAIQTLCKVVSSAVRRAGMENLYGVAGSTNVQGEEVKKLDVLANESLINALRDSGEVCAMVSEEDDEPIFVDVADAPNAKYVVVFDPLDGSSNIDANVSIGTIFGVYRRKTAVGTQATMEDVLRAGDEQVAAGYAMYGSATLLMLTTGKGVHGFTLDPSIGEFVLTHKDVKVPAKGKIYSTNEGNYSLLDAATRKYIDNCKAPASGKPFSARYIGSMVSDVHRTFLKGGIFMYPANTSAKAGKLRLLYEVAPMSMLMEQAGGAASTGSARTLEVVPTSIHQRLPVYLGSTENVRDLEKLVAEMQ